MNLLPLILLFPLIGFLINGLFGWRLKDRTVSIIGCTSIGLSFLFSILSFYNLLQLPEELRKIVYTLFVWLPSGSFSASFQYQLNPLSSVMTLIVSGVSLIIHIYSVGYMHGDRGYARYLSYLNLFTFMMLNLVLADNFLLMFLGWEGVGLCSYLLIGFWYEKDFAADAGKKAFIVSRIGDFGFILGIILIFINFGSINFDDVFKSAAAYPSGSFILTTITLLLFMGAVGKSAQIPLYVWLPDAMAGPTPVSALIHAATMVTAGVYMVARTAPLFSLAPSTMYIISGIGAFTALYAATIAVFQNDIKKVLAYSTISQLGYMFMAVGVGAFAAGIFHLMTHAFFKSLLFLSAGSVIHALNGVQDMRKMGGLKKYLPITYWTCITAAFAISGLPGFSGFFSKDEILWYAYSSKAGNITLWLLGIITAVLTSVYVFRLIFLTFHGERRWEEGISPRESPGVMTVPL
ncbi:MAG: NADH-quinone oxidoreductase subunit L, partial [Fidelibacterota bacterium]